LAPADRTQRCLSQRRAARAVAAGDPRLEPALRDRGGRLPERSPGLREQRGATGGHGDAVLEQATARQFFFAAHRFPVVDVLGASYAARSSPRLGV